MSDREALTRESAPDHDWVFVVSIPVTRREVERVRQGGRLVFRKLDPTSAEVRTAAVGCYACEATMEEAWGKPCPGEPSYYDAQGVPRWGERHG